MDDDPQDIDPEDLDDSEDYEAFITMMEIIDG